MMMTTSEIKEKLHSYIETAREEDLKVFFKLIEGNLEGNYNFWDDKDFIDVLQEREINYQKGKSKTFSLKETIDRAKKSILSL